MSESDNIRATSYTLSIKTFLYINSSGNTPPVHVYCGMQRVKLTCLVKFAVLLNVCLTINALKLCNSVLMLMALSLSTDVESVMNSIVSLLLILETDKQEALIESLCEKLVKFREGERPSLRMQLLVPSSPFPEDFQNKRLLI